MLKLDGDHDERYTVPDKPQYINFILMRKFPSLLAFSQKHRCAEVHLSFILAWTNAIVGNLNDNYSS